MLSRILDSMQVKTSIIWLAKQDSNESNNKVFQTINYLTNNQCEKLKRMNQLAESDVFICSNFDHETYVFRYIIHNDEQLSNGLKALQKNIQKSFSNLLHHRFLVINELGSSKKEVIKSLINNPIIEELIC